MILAIDPGPKESAWCLWDGKRIKGKGIVPTQDITALQAFEFVEMVAVEHLQCFGMAVGADVFETAYWIGEFRGYCGAENIRFFRVYRSEVKMHLCGSMRAKDGNVRQALIDRFGAPGVKKNPGLTYGVHGHEWSAFAIAVTVFDKENAQLGFHVPS